MIFICKWCVEALNITEAQLMYLSTGFLSRSECPQPQSSVPSLNVPICGAGGHPSLPLTQHPQKCVTGTVL